LVVVLPPSKSIRDSEKLQTRSADLHSIIVGHINRIEKRSDLIASVPSNHDG
jgi:hypothetical protein